MRALGLIGLLAAAAIVLVAMVVVGRGLADSTGDGPSHVQTGADKAYNELKKDGDMDDPKAEMRDALKGNL
jgi:hypothetical protein